MSIPLSKQVNVSGRGMVDDCSNVSTLHVAYLFYGFVIYSQYIGIRHSLIRIWLYVGFIGVVQAEELLNNLHQGKKERLQGHLAYNFTIWLYSVQYLMGHFAKGFICAVTAVKRSDGSLGEDCKLSVVWTLWWKQE